MKTHLVLPKLHRTSSNISMVSHPFTFFIIALFFRLFFLDSTFMTRAYTKTIWMTNDDGIEHGDVNTRTVLTNSYD